MEEIGKQNWEYAHRLFQCVAAASRPLRVEELAEFLAFDFDADSTPTLREDWREEDPAHAVLSTCSSLLTIVGENDAKIIQFSHFSVKEYLTSNRLSEGKDTISRFYVSMTPAHTIIAQACLGVLLHIDENITEGDLKKFPLAEYAARHWVSHARFEGVSRNIEDGMKRLFDPNNLHLAIWVRICDPESPWLKDERTECPSEARATALHYAAFCGLHDIVKFLIVERSQDVNTRDFGSGETPLLVGSRKGHSEVARVLLEHDADTEIRDKRSWSPLDRASENGSMEVVQVLLEHGADLKALDRNDWTALHVASMNGKLSVALVLLENGADTNARNSKNKTPLHFASEYGYLDLARMLLQRGADIHARANDGQTPFQGASAGGHKDVMQLLLEHGAEDHRTQ